MVDTVVFLSCVIGYCVMIPISSAIFYRAWKFGSGDDPLQWLAGALWPLCFVCWLPVKLGAKLYDCVLNYERKPKDKVPQARVIKG